MARERASFLERHDASPDEILEQDILGRCLVPEYGSGWWGRLLYSDGTLLDSPLSSEVLADITTNLQKSVPPFTVFGLTARSLGASAIVLFQYGSPRASIRASTADEGRSVRVEGGLRGGLVRPGAIINQGEFGTEDCQRNWGMALPRYSFTCQMAPGDDEALVVVFAIEEAANWERPVAHLPVRTASFAPPSEYQRPRPNLSPHLGTAEAISTFVNDARVSLGRKPFEFSPEQSAVMEPLYEKAFRITAGGDWEGDRELRMEALRGTGIGEPIWWSRSVSGIAFDGNASDWLAYRLRDPMWRKALMDPRGDRLALTTQADPAVGFGALATIYSLVTPERLLGLSDDVMEVVADAREEPKVELPENPPELLKAAASVASGESSPESAFAASLAQLNVGSGSDYVEGVFLSTAQISSGAELPDELLDPDELTYGVVTTFYEDPSELWAHVVVFVWFLGERPEKLTSVSPRAPMH